MQERTEGSANSLGNTAGTELSQRRRHDGTPVDGCDVLCILIDYINLIRFD